MSDSTTIKWLKRIFSAVTITGTILGLFFSVYQWRHETGGQLNASYNREVLRNNERKDLLVFTDSKEFHIKDLCPDFNNIDRFALKDFYLEHIMDMQNVRVQNTDFYNIFNLSENSTCFRYYDNTLSPHQSAGNPISKISMDSQRGSCTIESKATWDGAEKPFLFRADIRFNYIPLTKNESFVSWQKRCQDYIAANYGNLPVYDAIYKSTKGEDRLYNVTHVPEPKTESAQCAQAEPEKKPSEPVKKPSEPAKTRTAPVKTPAKATEQKALELKSSFARSAGVQEIFIADSTVTGSTTTYTIQYKVDETIADAFLVYLYDYNGYRRIDAVSTTLNKYVLEHKISLLESKIIRILGVAQQDPSLQQHIEINGNKLRNNHPSKYIGIRFKYPNKTTGSTYYVVSTVIQPNSSVSYTLDESVVYEILNCYDITDEMLAFAPELKEKSVNSGKSKDKSLWVIFLLAIVGFIIVGIGIVVADRTGEDRWMTLSLCISTVIWCLIALYYFL